MAAIGLIFGELNANHYRDETAADSRIDALREKMVVKENPRYTTDYYDPEKRAIPNCLQVFFTDGSQTDQVEVEYPVGHRRRREEGVPMMKRKFADAVSGYYTEEKSAKIVSVFEDESRLDALTATELIDYFI